MAFVPNASGTTGAEESGGGIGASIGKMFGTDSSRSEAVKGAEAFKSAAKAGGFRIDPDAAKAALKDLDRAEEAALKNRRATDRVARLLPIGGTGYAKTIAGKYEEGGLSAKNAVEADIKVIGFIREAVEAAVKNYQRMEGDNAQPFDRGLQS